MDRLSLKVDYDMEAMEKKYPPLKEAHTALDEISQDSEARLEYDKRQAAIYFNELAMEKKFAEGIEKGQYETACKNALAMRTKNLPMELIIEITGLTREEIENLS